MPWIARLTIIRATKTHALTADQEPGRHRRGEVVSVREVAALPDPGTVFSHRTFVYAYITDIPDTRTVQQLQEKVTQSHDSDQIGRVQLDNMVGTFQVGETVSEPGGATATITAVFDEAGITITDWSGSKPAQGAVVTGQTSGATGEFVHFDGMLLGRKRLFIPVSEIPASHRNRFIANGWSDATWTQAANFFKRRVAGTVPAGTGDPADDNLDDAAGTAEDITA